MLNVMTVTTRLEFHDSVFLMWGKLQQLFRRQLTPSAEPKPVLTSAEPTSVGVGLERERRDFTALAREFETLFSYRPDLIPLVTEVKAGQEVVAVRKTLQEALARERETLRELLESLKPQLQRLGETFGSGELQEHLGGLLTTLQTSLPTKTTVDSFHRLYQVELSKLPGEQPVLTEATAALDFERETLENLASEMIVFESQEAKPISSSSLVKPSAYEQSLEAQGEMLAELEMSLMRYQGHPLAEYQDFSAALTALKAAQETKHIAPELVLRTRESYHRFESLRQQQAQSLHEEQKARLQAHLTTLRALPVLPSLQRQAESTKRVLEDYLAQLELAPLEDHAIKSAGALLEDFKKHLDLSYRSELMTLVGRAAAAKATGILVELQRAGQLLEQGHYPNLETLARSLDQTVAQDKHRAQSQQRAYKFEHDLQAAFVAFGPLAKLNNDEVADVRQSLAYLESQREHFLSSSSVVQRELQKALTQAKSKLKKLAKQLVATSAVAEQLVASHLLDDLFDAPSAEVKDVPPGPKNNPLLSRF
jgi:hypothetical protein